MVKSTVESSHRQALDDWLRFIRAESHILQHNTQLLYQQAATSEVAGIPVDDGHEARAFAEPGIRSMECGSPVSIVLP
jgi:hypothetical protein